MATDEIIIPQAGVVPMRGRQVCLITSRWDGTWILPKGMIDPGFTPEEAALQEAWEEAGLTGEIEGEVVGSYRYRKGTRIHEVSLFRMRVEEVHQEYPEFEQRERHWFFPLIAVRMIGNAALKKTFCEIMGLPEPGEEK